MDVSFPPLDEHLVEPEVTRDEMIRGRRVVAMPALPPHGDRHFELDFVLRGSVAPGYVGSTDLITRFTRGSDFATDTCIRRDGTDPATGTRWLEEVAFEIVNEQTMRDVTDKAEDLVVRGVRRVFAIFVKQGWVGEWTANRRTFQRLDPGATIADPTLRRPIRVRALLDAAEADNAVAQGLVDKKNPVIEAVRKEAHLEGRRAALFAILEARGIDAGDDGRARILACEDVPVLDRWIAKAAVARSVDEVIGAPA